MIEQLTDEERSALESGMCQGGMKALRIIDAHAADRAGLERELREVERENALDIRYLRDVAESQITQLQRDRESLVAQLEAANVRRADEQRVLDVVERAYDGRLGLPTDNPAWREVFAAERARRKS